MVFCVIYVSVGCLGVDWFCYVVFMIVFFIIFDWVYECEYWWCGYFWVVGVDEVGCGVWVGLLMVVVVILFGML